MKKVLCLILTGLLLTGCVNSEEKIGVETAIKYVDGYFSKIVVEIPKITSTKPGAIALNEKMIEEVVKDTYGYAAELSNNGCENGVEVKYDYLIKDNIIAIYIVGNEGNVCGLAQSGDGVDEYNYFYNLDTDKELTLIEALPLLGYTKDDLKQFNLNSFEDLNDGCSNYVIKNGKGKLTFEYCM